MLKNLSCFFFLCRVTGPATSGGRGGAWFFKKCPCYYVLILFSSQRVILETHRLMYKKTSLCAVKCQFFQITPSGYALWNWHALVHEQYFSKYRFLDIYRCSFKCTITKLLRGWLYGDFHSELKFQLEIHSSKKLQIPGWNIIVSNK